jgi:hypothetical protein
MLSGRIISGVLKIFLAWPPGDTPISKEALLFPIPPLFCQKSYSSSDQSVESLKCLDIDVTCMDKILSAIMFELNVLEITRLSFPIQVRALNFLIAKRVPDFFKSALSSRN